MEQRQRRGRGGRIVSLSPYTPEEAVAAATQRQQIAADPVTSAWVEASAGSGKTKVLTDRVLRLMLAGVAPARILCITFTRAAAAEMNLRIAAQLGRWATFDDAALAAALAGLLGRPPEPATLQLARRLFAAVLDVPGGMKIMTIHAFCQSVLRRFPLEAGVAPHFEVMQDSDAREMLEDAQAEILAEAQREASPLAGALAELTARVHETRFADLLDDLTFARARLAAGLRAHGGPQGLAAAVRVRLGIEPGVGEADIVAVACADGAFDELGLRRAAMALEHGARTDQRHATIVAGWLAGDVAERIARFDEWRSVFFTQKGSVRASLASKGAREHDPSVDDVLGAEAARLDAVENRRRKAILADATAALIEVGAALLDSYRRHKAARALLDYDDLILLVSGLLRDVGAAWVLFKLDGGIDHVLVDEAQDTNPEQWAVVEALVDEYFAGRSAGDERAEETGMPARTVFAVGDVKQSIYSFQGAAPRQFGIVRALLHDRARAAERRWADVPLNVSFRSTPAVLQAVDALFADPAARAGVILDAVGDGTVEHLARRAREAGRVEMWQPLEPDEDTVTEAWKPPVERVGADPPRARLARLLARRIAGWVGSEMLEARGRPMQPGDIMVLVRRRGPFVADLVRALKECDVPVAGVDRMVLTEQLAVMDLVALGRFLLLPQDDLTLATVLKGPLVGLDEEALFSLAWRRDGDLWSALRARVGREPADSPIRRAHDYLAGLLDRVDFERPYELYAALLNAGGRRRILARLGVDAADPLDEFLALAQAYERTNTPSLQGFLHWLEAGEAEIKRDLEAGGGAVRVMTVHGAKGLEAPVVILADTLQKPRSTATLFWPDAATDAADADDAPDGDVPLWVPRAGLADDVAVAARDGAARAQDEEYRRLLYVAMTRAEDRLYVCGWQTKNAPPDDCWYNLIRNALEPVGQAVEDPFLAADPEDIDPSVLRLDNAQQEDAPAPSEAIARTPEPLPGWAGTPPPPEPYPPRPLAPSQPDDAEPPLRSPVGAAPDDALRFRRGTIIHRLLQALPDLPEAARADAAARYLARPALDLDPAQQRQIADEVLAVMTDPAFAALFGPDSLAEVPLTGLVADSDGRPQIVSGQLDRLVVADGTVTVVDYKTNRPPPRSADAVPDIYRRQMAAYRALLTAIYPGLAVRCCLLWTDGPDLMALDDAMLDGFAPVSAA
jgi:ATP-dependent helicase/nuclease subunit A